MLIIKGWRKSLACETMTVLRAIAIGSVCKYEAGMMVGGSCPCPYASYYRPVAVDVVDDVIVSEPPCWWTVKHGVRYGELV